jgi:adenine-specific DNA-methyltransferase
VIGAAHEYILVYAKRFCDIQLNLRERTEGQLARYKNPDNHPKGAWTSGDLGANVKGGRYVQSLNFGIINPNTGEEHFPPQNGNWRFNKDKITELMRNDEIFFGEDGKGRPKLKRFLCDVKDGITYTSLWDFVPLNTAGSSEMTAILGNIAIFDNPKPLGLIKEICKLGNGSDNIILDFFSGSATTAHAVMQLNAEDGGKRKFIMVQLPEVCAEGSEASKAGYANICEIGKERIRRAGDRIKQGVYVSHKTPTTHITTTTLPEFGSNGDVKIDTEERQSETIEIKNVPFDFDTGFRVLKLADTNMNDVYYAAGDYTQDMLLLMQDNIKPDRTDMDLLFGCLLDWGLPLSMPHTHEVINGATVHTYNGGDLIACFASAVSETVVREIAKRRPLRAVFRDSSFTSSPEKINVTEIFKLLAPNTTVRMI